MRLRTFTGQQVLKQRINFQRHTYPSQILRSYVHTPPAPRGHRNKFLSPFFTGVLVVGIATTIYGVYDIYDTMSMWPVEVRKDLKAGLLAKNKGDLELSSQYLRRAWNTAQEMQIEAFKTDPLLKTSGIAISLANVLELDNKLEQAYDVYVQALSQIRDYSKKVRISDVENMRAATIAYRLGELAHELERPEGEEEWLVAAVETILKNFKTVEPVAMDKIRQQSSAEIESMTSGLDLPKWVARCDIAAIFEALGSFYGRAERFDYAVPLYLQAVSILIPPPPQQSSAEDRCRGAQLMGNMSELLMRNSLSADSLSQAESWANMGLDIIKNTRKSELDKIDVCEVGYGFMLFNVGMIQEALDKKKEAQNLLTQSLNQFKEIGSEENIIHAHQALKKLNVP